MAMALRHINLEITSQSQTILQRIAAADKSAINECLNTYGDFVWQTVRKHSESNTGAEKMVQEVFKDIWQYAARYDKYL